MREKMFRGLEVMTCDWVYGSHVRTGVGSHYILPQNLIASDIPQYHVDGDTVGQYTGLKDKNGKKIFEGDIVEQEFFDSRQLDFGSFTGTVKFYEGCWWICNGVNHSERLWSEINTNEVLGNIYENLELLEDRSDGGLLKCYESGTL
jgi:uncharacterized phage protein (TIGR01671 family)